MGAIQYNYYCLSRECSINSLVPVVKDEEDREREEPCPQCSNPMKRMGQKAVAFSNSKEGQFQMMQNMVREKAKKHDADPEIQKLKKKRASEEIKNVSGGK